MKKGRENSRPLSNLLRPLYHGWHGRENGIHIATGLETKDRAAIIKQVEFDIASAADQLFLAIFRCPVLVKILAHQMRINNREPTAHITGEGKILIPAALLFR